MFQSLFCWKRLIGFTAATGPIGWVMFQSFFCWKRLIGGRKYNYTSGSFSGFQSLFCWKRLIGRLLTCGDRPL